MWESKKEKTFDELTGMSREDFDARMLEAKEAKTKLETMETQVSEIGTLKAELAALKNPPKPRVESEPTNFFEDPEQRMTERLNPIANVAIDTKASLEEMRARNKFQKEFSRWGSEVEEIMAKESSAFKANPAAWENVINIVRGKHAVEIEESARKGQYFFTEQPGGNTVGGTNDAPESKLSADELNSAKRMGMTPKEFLEAQSYVLSQYGHTKGGTIVH